MIGTISPNTKAILLLTGPLLVERDKKSKELLSPGEYKKFARHLHTLEREPADLLASEADNLILGCNDVIDAGRLKTLLARGFLLSQAVERWQARAIWVVSRADTDYPKAIRSRLKADSPPIIYGCGDPQILDSGGLAVVGSRKVDEALIEYTQDIGRLTAVSQQTLVSGGARGVDQAAMRGALEAGGRAVGVLADSLQKKVMNREHRNLLLEGQLTLISPFDPSAGFNVGNAMQRNKMIYALADAALVVSTELDKGGTWAGAKEQLKKLHFVPIYIRSIGKASEGLEALKNMGAQVWPNPSDTDELNTTLAAAGVKLLPKQMQDQLSLDVVLDDDTASSEDGQVSEGAESADSISKHSDPPVKDAAFELFQTVRTLILRLLSTHKKSAEIARKLAVTQQQADEWLKRLVDEGIVEKMKKPVRYTIRQANLFGEDIRVYEEFPKEVLDD
jgi:DNA processing protein